MTSLFDALLAAALAVILNFLVAGIVASRSAAESRFLLKIFGWTLVLRYGLAVVLNIYAVGSTFNATFWGDSETYDVGGAQLARAWSGEAVASAYLGTSVSGYGWTYFVGAIYFLIGRNQLLVQFINGTLGALTVIVIYSIAARLFGSVAARWAALFMAFFPQMVFWSAGMYKDPAILLCISICMYAVLRLRERFTLGMTLLFIASELALVTLRFYVAYFVAFAALATFLFTQRRNPIRTILTYCLLVVFLFGALTLAVRRETLDQQASYMTLERLQVTRQDQATWGSSGFGQQHNVSTPGGALMALPTGLVYLLFAPFPWSISGIRQAMALPETLVWYALMPAFVRGVAHAARHRLREILPIMVFAITLTSAYAIMQGNVGTAYRQRTQVSMFFFVFMGAGLAYTRGERRIDSRHPIELPPADA